MSTPAPTPRLGTRSAGIRQGDVATGFGGKPVDRMRQLLCIVATVKIGRSVPVSIVQGGRPETIQVTVGELKPEARQGAVRRVQRCAARFDAGPSRLSSCSVSNWRH